MESHTLELITAIATTAAACTGGGTVLLNWRLGAFEAKLMKSLNGTYVRRNECTLSHTSTEQRLESVERKLEGLS